jgi:uncharacterized OsmC-like protein
MFAVNENGLQRVNGIDVAALRKLMDDVESEPAKGRAEFLVRSHWLGQMRSETRVDSYRIGGRRVERHFTIAVDEPTELLGRNTAPNPQEMLMTALNSCLMVGYVAGAALRGIQLDKIEIETRGRLDLRGFLGIDPAVPSGYELIEFEVHIKSDGSPDALLDLHETVLRTSPSYFNITRPIRIEARLIIE